MYKFVCDPEALFQMAAPGDRARGEEQVTIGLSMIVILTELSSLSPMTILVFVTGRSFARKYEYR